MYSNVISLAKKVAIQAALKAGKQLAMHFNRPIELHEKDSLGDIVTEMDYMAEQIIRDEIVACFPEHQISGEEFGHNGLSSDWLWSIDPLDGTNNFAIGLPIFSVSITLIYQLEPVLGVIYEPLVDRLYVTAKDEGAYCNNVKMQVNKRENIIQGTVGWIQGHKVQHDEKAVQLRQYIDTHFKRMIRLWAPTLQWCMLAKGDLDGIILYNSEGEDLYAGLLMVKEAGGLVVDFNGDEVKEMVTEPYLIACHPHYKDYFLNIVNATHTGRTYPVK